MYYGLESIRRERAALERDRVIIESICNSLDEAEELQGTLGLKEPALPDNAIGEIIKRTPLPEPSDREEQIDKVMNAQYGLSAEQIIGVEPVDSDEDDTNIDKEGGQQLTDLEEEDETSGIKKELENINKDSDEDMAKDDDFMAEFSSLY